MQCYDKWWAGTGAGTLRLKCVLAMWWQLVQSQHGGQHSASSDLNL